MIEYHKRIVIFTAIVAIAVVMLISAGYISNSRSKLTDGHVVIREHLVIREHVAANTIESDPMEKLLADTSASFLATTEKSFAKPIERRILNLESNPSNDLTLSPTEDFTLNPTKKLTLNPIEEFTLHPVEEATLNPTKVLTLNPTEEEMLNPTEDWTLNPVRQVTLNPMDLVDVTLDKTLNPTVFSKSWNPTEELSLHPTEEHTLAPIEEFSLHPTEKRTLSPTEERTLNPTEELTLSPIEERTLNPTEERTLNPTEEISLSPTNDLTLNPTLSSIDIVATGNEWSIVRAGYSQLPYFSTDDDYLTYSVLSSYRGVIEPNAAMKLYVSNVSKYETYASLTYTVCPVTTSNSDNCEEGTVNISDKQSTDFSMDCTPLDEYEILISGFDATSQIAEALVSFKALCLYVRREIRQLSSLDLNTTLDAMATLWSTSEEQGQALYGSNFHNISYFTRAQIFGASHRNADHINEGLGFLTQHMKLTNVFELALQAVDSSLTLPYWDFTIDEEDSDYYMFQGSTFGSLSVPNEDTWTFRSDSITDARIPDGRWKDLKVEEATYFPEETISSNAYGYARSPWNFNPSPYVSRFSSAHLSLPSCRSFHKWLRYDSLDDFLSSAETSPETGAHDSVGGNFGCDKFDFMKIKGWIDDPATICSKWGAYMKTLWREHWITPDSSCTPSASIEAPSCGFVCDQSRLSQLTEEMKLVIKGLNNNVMTTKDWECMQKFVCEAGGNYMSFFGDQRESTSSYDPSFWPIHPTLERAYHAKMLVGGFTKSSAWGAAGDSICYRSSCYNDDDDAVKDQYDECCTGHLERDRFPNFLSGVLTDEGVWQTNGEYLNATDPTSSSYSMGYIYDSFSWGHCGDGTDSTDGADVDALLKSLYDGTYVDSDDSIQPVRTEAPSPVMVTRAPTVFHDDSTCDIDH